MRLFCLFFLIWVQEALWSGNSSLGSIEAVIVADLRDESIGCARDVANMKKSLCVIGEKIGFKVSTTILKPQDFVARTVIQKLKSLSFSRNNIVVFYYTGHGFNDENKRSPWPTLFTRKQRLAGSAVVKYLQHRPSRCSIIIFDCCNDKTSMGKIVHSFRSATRPSLSYGDDLSGFASLLLETRGSVVMAAAKVGEKAEGGWATGGVFTEGLLLSVKKLGSDKNLTWDALFQEASTRTTSNSAGGEQHPFFALEPGKTIFTPDVLCDAIVRVFTNIP
jgi:hypothetical protein